MADAEDPSKKYDQAFFLTRAAKGKEAWNAWRRDPANKDVRVTFASIDFSEAPRDEIDFSGFEFGDEANFAGCRWRGLEWEEIPKDPKAFKPGRACFTGAAFGEGASFGGAAFDDWGTFDRAAFGERTGFDGAVFGYGASFNGADFGYGTSFGSAVFDGRASFNGATFGDLATFVCAAFGIRASFTGADFGDNATFTGAAFGPAAIFADTRFKGCVEFSGTSSEGWSRSLGLTAEETNEKVKEGGIALKKRHEDSWKRWGSGPDRFLTISFAHARFHGEANFSGRTFEGPPILSRRAFTTRRILVLRPSMPGPISLAPTLVLLAPTASIGLPKPKSRFNSAVFGNSPKIGRTTISNATFISRNARPNAASTSINF